MNGRNTIIIMLEWYFQATENQIPRFKRVCDLLLGGLIDGSYERTPSFHELEAEINALARVFLPGNHRNLTTIQKDLWTLLVNWWDTVQWARREVREKDVLLADLLENIVSEIKNHANVDVRGHYTYQVLQALIQMSTSGYITDPYLRQRLRRQINLRQILEEYQELSRRHGFGDDLHILLQLLCDIMNRNVNTHATYKVKEYKLYCKQFKIEPSFDDYITYRGLNISPQYLAHCRRLFLTKFGI